MTGANFGGNVHLTVPQQDDFLTGSEMSDLISSDGYTVEQLAVPLSSEGSRKSKSCGVPRKQPEPSVVQKKTTEFTFKPSDVVSGFSSISLFGEKRKPSPKPAAAAVSPPKPASPPASSSKQVRRRKRSSCRSASKSASSDEEEHHKARKFSKQISRIPTSPIIIGYPGDQFHFGVASPDKYDKDDLQTLIRVMDGEPIDDSFSELSSVRENGSDSDPEVIEAPIAPEYSELLYK